MCLRKTRAGKSRDYRRDAIGFEKPRFQNVFRPHENEKPASSNFSLQFEEHFRKALLSVWTVGLIAEIKLRFEISPSPLLRRPLSSSHNIPWGGVRDKP